MYFPGRGAFPALGKTLFGHPWAGVSASTALLCCAIRRTPQNEFSAGLAPAVGLLAIFQIIRVKH